MGFEPIRLPKRISNVAFSPPIPTLQASPGITVLISRRIWLRIEEILAPNRSDYTYWELGMHILRYFLMGNLLNRG
jgi:hypothetical protein